MKRKTLSALLAGFAATAMFASTGAATGTVMYDSVPDPLPAHLDLSPIFRGGASEFAQLITPVTAGPLGSVTVTLTSRACEQGDFRELSCETTLNDDGSLPTFEHPITINLYEPPDPTSGAPGDLIGSVTRQVAVPYRPSANGCFNGGWGWSVDGTDRCGTDYAFNATFDFTRQHIELPTEFVVGVAFDNSHNDLSLTPGPYDWLAVGFNRYAPDLAVGTAGQNYTRSPDGFFRNYYGSGLMIRLETAPSGPVTADDCKAGGFAKYEFTNQGQCVSSVNASENAGK